MWSVLLAGVTAVSGAGETTIFVDLAEGKLMIQESWVVVLESEAAPGEFVVHLPPGATKIRQPDDQSSFATGSEQVVNREPLGSGRHHFFYSYDLPYASSELSLAWRDPPVEVNAIQLAVPVIEGFNVGTPKPGRTSPREIKGVPYTLHEIREPFTAGRFAVKLNGIPYRAQWPRWAAVGLCVLLVVLTLTRVFSPTAAEEDRPALAARKERLKQAIELLEADRPEMEARAYDRRRDELVGQLAEVLRREAR